MVKLTIIIPCYNSEPYISELLGILDKQINSSVEVIVVDDGSKIPFKSNYEWVRLVRQKNGGASAARNKGLDLAKGEYIAFIDADDRVSEDYIKIIFEKLKENPDYIYMSWESFGGWNQRIILNSINDEFPPYNLCVWNRIYKRELIGNVRFNIKKLIAEDAEFIRKVKIQGKKREFISSPIYKYRSNTPNSLTKRFSKGELNTHRVVYYFERVEANKRYLIDEFKKADEDGEVILLTRHNEIPELAKYAMIMEPCRVKATEARGEHTNLIEIIDKPIKTQVVIWTHETFEIGGIETYIYQFCKIMSQYKNIMVLYDRMDYRQIERITPYAECKKNDGKPIECDVLIVNRIIDEMPGNVIAKKTVQMVHGVKHSNYHVPQDKDIIVSVSDAVKESFEEETKDSVVIKNMLEIEQPKEKPILIVSTTRIDCADKGLNRMIKLAELMKEQGVKYIWLLFTNAELPRNAPKEMIRMDATLDIEPWISKADYICQLSDHEAFCYSIAESLCLNTPIIATPLDVLKEFGFKEGKHGYTVPFDITEYNTRKFLKVPQFEYSFSNDESIKGWLELLGKAKPKKKYEPPKNVWIIAQMDYFDNALNRNINAGERYLVSEARAEVITNANFAIYDN